MARHRHTHTVGTAHTAGARDTVVGGGSGAPGREDVRVNSSGIEHLDQAVAPSGPPAGLGWRARRAAKADAARAAAVARQIAHAQRRARQVAAAGILTPEMPAPRTPLDDAQPPWPADGHRAGRGSATSLHANG